MMTTVAATIWVFAYVTALGPPQPIFGGYGPKFVTESECRHHLSAYGDWLTCVRIP